MRRDPLERLTIRAALVLGFGLVLGLWLLTGYALTARLEETSAETASITRRYMNAQDVLSSVRQQVNISSIALRDALLDRDPEAQARHRRRIEETYAAIDAQLAGYQPVQGQGAQELHQLRQEVADYRRVIFQVLDESRASPSTPPGDLLARHVVPRRTAAIALSDEIRALNRRALVEHQSATAAVQRASERRWWFGGGAALLATLAIAFIAIVYAGRLEDRLRRGRERDAQHARDLQRLSARLVEVQEEERRTIARELHDEVGQVLSAIAVEAQLAVDAIDNPVDARRALTEVQQLADGAIGTVRDLSQLLRPGMLDDLGLPAAVDWLLRGLARRHEIDVQLLQEGITDRLPPNVEVTAFRIVQEALTNVSRYADARRCTVRIERDASCLQVSVTDDGRGFDPAATSPPGTRRGMGLMGIRERAADLGGTLTIDSGPGRGTWLRVSLPLAAPGHTASSQLDTSLPHTGLEPGVARG